MKNTNMLFSILTIFEASWSGARVEASFVIPNGHYSLVAVNPGQEGKFMYPRENAVSNYVCFSQPATSPYWFSGNMPSWNITYAEQDQHDEQGGYTIRNGATKNGDFLTANRMYKYCRMSPNAFNTFVLSAEAMPNGMPGMAFSFYLTASKVPSVLPGNFWPGSHDDYFAVDSKNNLKLVSYEDRHVFLLVPRGD